MALGNGNISLVKGREGIVTVLKHNMALGNGNISLVKGREGKGRDCYSPETQYGTGQR